MSTATELDRNAVTILWIDDFYDGPISGIAEMAGTKYRFDLVDRNVLGGHKEDRRYWLIALTDHQLQDEIYWHELFCRKVGTHCDLTGRSPLPRELVDLDGFYVPYRKRVPPDYSQNEVVGWFRL